MMILFSVLCIILDGAPQSIEEWTAVRGVSLKIGHICNLEGNNIVSGPGVDIHMWRIFVHLRWIKPAEVYNVEQATRQIMAWFPKVYWAELNEIYAGLGQLLQMKEQSTKDKVKNKMRGLAKKTNSSVARMVETLLCIPEYDR